MKYSLLRSLSMMTLICLLLTMGFSTAEEESRGMVWDARYGEGEVTGDYMGTWTIAFCDEWVSLRRQPDSNSERIIKVPKWASVEAYYYDSNWFECFYNGQRGYISREYLTDRPGKFPDYPGNLEYSYTESRNSDMYDLDNFGYRTVTTKGRGKLVFQSAPGGSFMRDYKFYDGDSIYVNLYWRKNGYAIAYSNGSYGYVDASYIDWNDSYDPAPSPVSEKNDLSKFDWRIVNSNGRGSLIFQSSPGGTFLSNHKFHDGDYIYVNTEYRKNGYAYAYEDGEFGYVDASYIDW